MPLGMGSSGAQSVHRHGLPGSQGKLRDSHPVPPWLAGTHLTKAQLITSGTPRRTLGLAQVPPKQQKAPESHLHGSPASITFGQPRKRFMGCIFRGITYGLGQLKQAPMP